jgi:hypothetical protein
MSSPAVIEFLNPEDVTSTSRRWDVGEPTIVGRGADASIVLNVAAISRHHLQLTPQPRGWYASDLNSRNGTHLNGVAIGDEPVRLHDSDILVLAGSVTLRFRDPMATPIAPRIGRLVGVWIDPETDAVWVDARRVEPPLSARQLRLLKLMYDADGNIVTRADAIDAAWDDANAEGVTDDALAALIKRTRKRLADFENDGPNIEIVRNRGIRLRNVQ